MEEISSQHIFNERIGIAFFYFNFQAEAKIQSEASFLAILIKQLCRRQTEFSASLKSLHKASVRDHSQPSVAEYNKRQLADIVMTIDHVFIMIDALDECARDHRPSFLQHIVSLLQLPSGKLKIFVYLGLLGSTCTGVFLPHYQKTYKLFFEHFALVPLAGLHMLRQAEATGAMGAMGGPAEYLCLVGRVDILH